MARYKHAVKPTGDLRARLRDANQKSVDRYPGILSTPWKRTVHALDAGLTVFASGWQIGKDHDVDPNGYYAIDALGNITPARIDRT
jgi:hypothetical protein